MRKKPITKKMWKQTLELLELGETSEFHIELGDEAKIRVSACRLKKEGFDLTVIIKGNKAVVTRKQ